MKEKQQTINCDVKACTYNSKRGGCTLDSITVVPAQDIPTAHYCGDYEEK